MEVVNECDALFWVIDVNNGTINQSSLAVIREKLEKPLYIIVNKVDTKSSNEVDQVINVISNTLRSKGVEYKQIIRFSKLEDIDQLMTVIRSIRKTKQAGDYFERAQGMLNILEGDLWREYEETRKTQVQIDRLTSAIDNDIDGFNKVLDRVRDYADRLLNMPQMRSTWMGFGDNEYVMTEKQVKAFDRLIEEIAINQLNQLVDKFNSLQEHAFKFVELSSSIAGLDQLVEKGARVSEHKEQFDKLIKQLGR